MYKVKEFRKCKKVSKLLMRKVYEIVSFLLKWGKKVLKGPVYKGRMRVEEIF